MATNRFSVPIAKLAERVKLDIETVARKSAFELFTAVVNKSPVDTGRFRANWNYSLGSPDGSATASTTQGRGLQEASKALNMPIGGVAWLSNGLPYSKRLEYGSSKQAPSGMIRVSAIEFSQYVSEAVREAT